MIDDERSKSNNDNGGVPALNLRWLSPSPDLNESASLLEVSICAAKRVMIMLSIAVCILISSAIRANQLGRLRVLEFSVPI